MGKLQQHRIENREIKKLQNHMPLIEEMSGSMAPIINTINVQNNNIARMNYVILKKPLNSSAEHLIVLFNMPRSVSHKIIKYNLSYGLNIICFFLFAGFN